jgi:hypothetical protein
MIKPIMQTMIGQITGDNEYIRNIMLHFLGLITLLLTCSCQEIGRNTDSAGIAYLKSEYSYTKSQPDSSLIAVEALDSNFLVLTRVDFNRMGDTAQIESNRYFEGKLIQKIVKFKASPQYSYVNTFLYRKDTLIEEESRALASNKLREICLYSYVRGERVKICTDSLTYETVERYNHQDSISSVVYIELKGAQRDTVKRADFIYSNSNFRIRKATFSTDLASMQKDEGIVDYFYDNTNKLIKVMDKKTLQYRNHAESLCQSELTYDNKERVERMTTWCQGGEPDTVWYKYEGERLIGLERAPPKLSYAYLLRKLEDAK